MSNKAQAKRLIESEKHWGQPMTFAVSPFENGKVQLYDGHQRYAAWATVYGEDYEVDARQCDRHLTEEERIEFVVTMHAGATGSWDWQKLSSFPAPKLIEMGFDEDLKKQYDFDALNIKELLGSEEPPSVNTEGITVSNQYGVIVICDDEAHQEQVYTSLTEQGYKTKVVVV